MKTCNVDGCNRKHLARGMCSSHYASWHHEQRKYQITCPRCGKTTRVKRKSSRYCSQRCASLSAADVQSRIWSDARAKRYPPVPYTGPRYAYRLTQPQPKQPPRRGRWKSGQCRVCNKWFISIQFDATCSPECQAAHHRKVRRIGKDRRRARQHAAYVQDVYRKRVFEADGYRCHICRRKTDPTKHAPHPRSPTLDHVVPLAQGGTHEPTNCRCACFECNARKGDRGGGEQLVLIA